LHNYVSLNKIWLYIVYRSILYAFIVSLCTLRSMLLHLTAPFASSKLSVSRSIFYYDKTLYKMHTNDNKNTVHDAAKSWIREYYNHNF